MEEVEADTKAAAQAEAVEAEAAGAAAAAQAVAADGAGAGVGVAGGVASGSSLLKAAFAILDGERLLMVMAIFPILAKLIEGNLAAGMVLLRRAA